MPTGLVDQVDARVRSDQRTRRLFVVWQNPETRQFVHVAHLDVQADGQYVFEYEPDAEQAPGFDGFAAFPDLHHRYRSDRLFPFFTNRVLSPRRPEYETYLDALDITDDEQAPVELLARSGGTRATDTVHIVPEPRTEADGRQVLLFLASGMRHLESARERISQLSAGDELLLRPEPDNPVNPNALLLDNATGEPVGWVPDYLLDLVCGYRARGPVQVFVERANGPDAPPHLRLLCRLEAQPSPSGG
jgi:hypothetical protein